MAIACPVHAATTGLRNDSSRWDVTGAEHLQVETPAEHPVIALDHDSAGVVALSLVECGVDLGEHGRPEGIDLAVVHGDHGDRFVAAVTHAHRCSF
jgi:hypothetical protein